MDTQQKISSKGIYDKIYKLLIIIPLAVFIFSLASTIHFYNQNGDIILKDVSLTGGTTLTVFDKQADINQLKNSLKTEFPDITIRAISDFRTGAQYGIILETKSEPEQIKPALEKILSYNLTQDNSSIEFSGAALSQGFYQQLRAAIIIAFILMAIVVALIFRTVVPSGAVILCAFADILMTLAVVNLLGIAVSTAGIIAFMMLIGYSIDTDILLTTRLIKKREGTINQRIFSAFKTGITMTLTSIAAVSICLFIIYNFSETLRQIFTILLIGLFFDIFNTWITNASILKWYAEAKKL